MPETIHVLLELTPETIGYCPVFRRIATFGPDPGLLS